MFLAHLGGNRALKSAIASKGLFGYHLTAKCLKLQTSMSPPGPTTSFSNRKISLRLAKGPQLAGFDVGGSVSAETFSRPEPILGHLSLRGGIPFPGRTIIGSEGLALIW